MDIGKVLKNKYSFTPHDFITSHYKTFFSKTFSYSLYLQT